MRIRDALESDAEALADVTGRPADVLVDTIHDRTVRVALDGDGDRDGDHDGDGNRGTEGGFDATDGLDGFVAFDVRKGSVHVTDLAGTPSALERLVEEPKRFAKREGMDVEAVLVDGEERRADALENAGFTATGPGPRFEGRATTRFRLERDE
ncbi:hypothetical protein SAMN04488066_1322 [Halorubrum aquaticum]|uniref:N-acetyltransferase domain-containing protein n=1 Tax=Halorubrum aquaticum TaxID=387340 RepID=A0A1I3CVP6_9EURY|nr:hypothetical protein [Halorubrum aquaticum]SFH78582.1 hypothetical protein SAMN04488066_1322 [Halorubrum aquaticum]